MSTTALRRLEHVHWLSKILTLVCAAVLTATSFTLAYAQLDGQVRGNGERLAVLESRQVDLAAQDLRVSAEIAALKSRVDSLDQRVAMGQGAIGVIGVIFTCLQIVQLVSGRAARQRDAAE